MGNQASSSDASIFITTEKNVYNVGELVNGYIKAEVVNQTLCSNLYVQISGEVNTKVGYFSNNKKYYASDKMNLIDDEIRIANFPDNKIEPGSYQYQFSFELPSTLPDSCSFIQSDAKGSITYLVKVHMESQGFITTDLAEPLTLKIRGIPPKKSVNIMSEDDVEVNWFCCINRGNMVLRTRLPKDVYHSREKIKVKFEVNNMSPHPIKEVRVSLIERLELRAKSHCISRVNTLAKEVDSAINESFSNTIFLNIPDKSSLKYSTVQTCLMSITHEVVVEAQTGMCITNPKIKSPITLRRESTLPLKSEALNVIMESEESAENERLVLACASQYAPDKMTRKSSHQVEGTYYVSLND